MSRAVGGRLDEECSVIGEKGEIGFIDYEDDKSVCSYNPVEENPIVVSVPFPFLNGKPKSIIAGQTAVDSITVKNTTTEPMDIWGIRIYGAVPEGSFTLSVMKPPSDNSDVEALEAFLESSSLEDRMLQPGDTLTVWLSCKPKGIGLYTAAVHFDLECEKIERLVFLLADDNVSQSLVSRNPYSRGKKNNKKKQFSTDSYVTGPRPERQNPHRFKNRLPRYDIPKEIRALLESKQIPPVVHEGLTSLDNYVPYFKHLLIMEELQLEEDMRSYDMESVSFRTLGHQFLALEVPGLAERRPSLVHGDSIFAKPTSQDEYEIRPYEGCIHRVEADEVCLKFAPEFHFRHRDDNLYNVQFTFNRVNRRRLYQAVDAAEKLEAGFLFPSEACEIRQIIRKRLVPIYPRLNEEQICSVEKILGCKGVPPYVIHGPPGTGKTLTLTEAILQLYRYRRHARILVCAPSNSAADHILEKLLSQKSVQIRQNEIFRLNASSRSYEEMNPDLMDFCLFENNVFTCPALNELSRYRIIVSTYMSAAVLYAEGINRGHFTHIFLDEAGQASEPETMIPISHFSRRNTVVVLAGDPMQLGPVIYSKVSETYGLGTSYLERIFECEFYSDGDQNYVTKLIRNYRSHTEILSLPSQLFYNGQLVACKDNQAPFMEKVNFLPNREFPLLFYGIQGCDEREGNNPSWFNRIEASKVVEVVKRLRAIRDLCEKDIGIITPYRQQVLKIQKALENLDMPDIKVGSVEQFQGQEKQVIIVSTVRSTIRHNEFDKRHCLGFLSNSRRFNVAITRAISLLIIIGNPHIICQDPHWNQLLWRCIENNSYEGCAPPERQEVVYKDYSQGYGYDCNEENNAGWGDGSYNNAGWGDNSYNNAGWGNGPSNNAGWRDEPLKPTGWGDEPIKPTGWGDESYKPTECGDESNSGGRGDESSSNIGGGDEPYKAEVPKPAADEAEWSDGWK
ncbi:hypothetical protein UlMin_009241 [Ulmus minor]